MNPLFPPLVPVRSFSANTPDSLERYTRLPRYRGKAVASDTSDFFVRAGHTGSSWATIATHLPGRSVFDRPEQSVPGCGNHTHCKRHWERSGVSSTNGDLVGSGSTMDALWGL